MFINIVVAFSLYILLSPGLVLNIPAVQDSDSEYSFPPIFSVFSGKNTPISTVAHAVVFCVLYFLVAPFLVSKIPFLPSMN